jgi:hypothetical protein
MAVAPLHRIGKRTLCVSNTVGTWTWHRFNGKRTICTKKKNNTAGKCAISYRFKRRVGEQHLHTAGCFVVGQVGRIQVTFLSSQLKGHPRNKIHVHREGKG